MKKFLAVWALAMVLGQSAAGPASPERAGESKWKDAWTGVYYRAMLARDGLQPGDVANYSIGQSHIDAAWRWRAAQTHDKCRKTFGDAVAHMAMFPDFHFSQSAPQYYEWVMEDDPALFDKIVQLEKEGRWEIVGGQWVEPDNNMPDGESFVRQRLLGQRFYMEHFGHVPDISWLLDSFGYQWNLPQILAKSGARYFWTNKLTWNDTTIYPFHLFWWQAPDGSRVLAYFCKQAGGWIYPSPELSKYHDTRYLLPEGAPEFIADYSTPHSVIKQKMTGEWLNVVGIFYGRGDGGHGPVQAEIERQEYLAGQGYTHLSTAHELFSELDRHSDRAPVWNDELYLEYHRGVLTTQAWLKRANRQAEQMMRSAEVVQSVASRLGLDYAYARLKAAWKLLMLNQFHDILPGSSIPEVYEDSRKDHAAIRETAAQAAGDGLVLLASRINTRTKDGTLRPLMVFNTLSWERDGLVELDKGELPGGWRILDGDGKAVPSQTGNCRDLEGECFFFRAEQVPALGYRLYFLDGSGKEGGHVSGGPVAVEDADHITLSNGLVEIKVDKQTGWLSSLVDPLDGRQYLDGFGNRLLAWHDRAKNYPAWNIQKDYLEHERPMPDADEVAVTARGPLFVEVTVKRRFNVSDIVQVTRLYAGDPRVHLATAFDFHEADTLVKAEFDTNIKSDVITAEISYAAIDRPTHASTPAEAAQWEASCQRWLDLSDGGRGLALLNDGKYGYSLNADGTGFRLSMIKAALYPVSADEAVNVDDAGLPQWLKERRSRNRMTDQGSHVVRTALLAHGGDWKAARLWEAGYDFNTPFEAVISGQHQGDLAAAESFISLDNPDVYVGALKRAEDDNDLVIRLVEATGRGGRVRVRLDKLGRITHVVETDLLEWNPKPIASDKNSFELGLAPFEIKTVKIGLEK